MVRPSLRLFSEGFSEARVYLYDVDVHGQLFLSTTRIKNFTSCYKDPAFLSFFYSKLRRNELPDDEAQERRREGYDWLSLCGKERSYLRAVDTPLVYQRLEGGKLIYAGAESLQFDPSALKTDTQGYLYHPSPPSSLGRASRRRPSSSSPSPSSPADSADSQFGPYSLLRSSLVLEAFAKSLDLDPDSVDSSEGSEGGVGGSFEWEGERYRIGKLGEGEAIIGSGAEEVD